jgi:hypothetical protein
VILKYSLEVYIILSRIYNFTSISTVYCIAFSPSRLCGNSALKADSIAYATLSHSFPPVFTLEFTVNGRYLCAPLLIYIAALASLILVDHPTASLIVVMEVRSGVILSRTISEGLNAFRNSFYSTCESLGIPSSLQALDQISNEGNRYSYSIMDLS